MKTAKKTKAAVEQRAVESITITVTWSRQNNATAEAVVQFCDGSTATSRHRAGGGGYCKESTVLAAVFNEHLGYRLKDADLAAKAAADRPYRLNGEWRGTPYGMRLGDGGYFDGGIGVPAYFTIAEFLGGRLEELASNRGFGGRRPARPFTVYRYTASK